MAPAPEKGRLRVQADVLAAAEKWLSGNRSRIGKFTVNGRDFWIKKREVSGIVNRLQKGSPDRLFENKIAALAELSKLNVPVAKIVLKRPDLIVFEDAGATIESIIRDQTSRLEDRVVAYQQASRALAELHGMGISHGRPVLRDICWDGRQITFPDFENYSAANNTPKGHVRDLICFVLSLYAQFNREMPEISAALSAYREADSAGIWDQAGEKVRRNRWIDWVTRPIQARREPHAREFKAIPMTMNALTRP